VVQVIPGDRTLGSFSSRKPSDSILTLRKLRNQNHVTAETIIFSIAAATHTPQPVMTLSWTQNSRMTPLNTSTWMAKTWVPRCTFIIEARRVTQKIAVASTFM